MSIGLRTVVSALVVAAVLGCSKNDSVVELKGSCVDVYKSQVCTWARMQGENLVEVGATVPIGSIENSPADPPMVWPPVQVAVIDLADAAREKGELMNLSMYCEAHGHPPGEYITPHFD